MYILSQAAEAIASSGATKTELGAALAVLSSAVVFLYRLLTTKHEATEAFLTQKWEDCEKGHEEARKQAIEFATELGEVKGRLAVMSLQVLGRVHPEAEDDTKDELPRDS